MKEWKDFASSIPEQACSIYCGVLEYEDQILEDIQSGEEHEFLEWEPHVNPDNTDPDTILKDFNRFYYESFVNCIFPDKEQSDHPLYNEDYALKTVRLSRRIDQSMPVTIPRRGVFNIKFEHLDLYFFPHNIVFYCFKCDLKGFSLDEITLINSSLRNSGHTEELDFLYKPLAFLSPRKTGHHVDHKLSFGNKLKVFSLIEHNLELDKKEENMLLYDLGVCAPIGSADGSKPFFQPSDEYLKKLIAQNKISVFDNWSALALFDTFTGLFRKGALDNFSWENGYFNLLYIQSLFVKNYLFKTNKAFYAEEKHHQVMEDEFFKFNKYYNPSHISYNFLPAIIYNAIRRSLAVDDELKVLREGIERWNKKGKEKRDKMINDVLTMIALLAVFSVIWDLSEWLNKLFSGSTTSYMIMSGLLTFVVLAVLIAFLFKNRRRKR
jgi:hypothetical protein